MRGRMFLIAGLGTLLVTILTLTHLSVTRATAAPTREPSRIVKCKVMETHTSAERGVTLVIFHQSTKEEQKRLAEFLKQDSEAGVEWHSAAGSEWHAATVIRLKSCFGRGLLLFPAVTGGPKEGEDLLVKFPGANASAVK
jgi:hypothetical protein